jgi:DNA-binding beta-propeller fold protein YncE
VRKPANTAREDNLTLFESGQVRPLAISDDGCWLYAVNTPDNRLEVFRAERGALRSAGSVSVGLEPVAVAARNSTELWVVNHLSDSVSIVDVSDPARATVVRTLLVGDEPRDIVFAQGRAFITSAHRGQNTARDPQLTTPGVGRADVWVFDPERLGKSLAGDPVTVLSLFADTPRALAVSADGKTVYASAFHSGNQTTVVPERLVTNNGGLPPPWTDANGVPAPWTALIVKHRTGPDGKLHWLDELGRVFDDSVRFTLPDNDVFAIDATRSVPVQKPDGEISGVGTVLFNMAVNPVTGKVYVANLDSRNDVRFEGHNAFGGTGSVRGHLAESRISVIDKGQVTSRHLNSHIDYTREGTPAEASNSLAFPTGMAVSRDGRFLYVAALGSSKLGVFRTSELEAGSFVPSQQQSVRLTGGGPTGLVLDETAGVAYVMTRFDNGISTVDLARKREIAHTSMYNPEPPSITRGRRFLYDATATSAHGDSACASCHVFGDLDSLAWDLGDPDGAVVKLPGPFTLPPQGTQVSTDFHPIKGPMTTQSLRGMANHGPMHWRGDRTGGNDVPESAQPDTGTFDEQAAFKKFNQAFTGLLGRASELSSSEMQAFTDFVLQLSYPPNPVRNLDNSLTAQQERGRAFYFNQDADGKVIPSDSVFNCSGCHVLEPRGNAEYGVLKPGFFGSDGRYSFEAEPQIFKVAHLRNAYQKVGMFGMAASNGLPIDFDPPFNLTTPLPPPYNDVSFQGDQIRGFGYLHSGEIDTVFRFMGFNVFAQRAVTHPSPNPGGFSLDDAGIELRRSLEAFVLAFDTNLPPIVGQQVTLSKLNRDVAMPRLELLLQRAAADECEVVVRGRTHRREFGFLYDARSDRFAPDRTKAEAWTREELEDLSQHTALTFTAVPVGSGERIALDRDSNGVLDGNEND